MASSLLSIGELAQRAGVATSTLRFYEAQGLIRGSRSSGGHRQYARDVLRRVAFLRAGQRVGLSLDELRQALAGLPDGRTPTKADWERLARHWQTLLDERLALLQRLRDTLGGCIGCGCLSLKACALYNPDDAVAGRGPGARRLMLGEPLVG
jgi:MerR family redox-sensitive transcriptional activator SoxR